MIDYGYCIPNCPICSGLGHIGYDVPFGHPDFGKMHPCPNLFKAYWPKDIGIEEEEAHYLDLSKLKDTDLRRRSRNCLKQILKDKSGMLYLYGSVGIGKTVIAKAMLLWAVFKLHIYPAHYTTHAMMMDKLRSSFGEGYSSSQYDQILDYYANLPLLIIDEAGRDKASEFSLASFGKIMDRRYTQGKAGKAITLLVSNFKPEDILDNYLVDRIRDATNYVVSLETASLRKKDLKLERNENWWKELDHE